MAFTISPSVVVQERDFSLNVVSQANYIGATAGFAQWGPINKATLITGGEADFIARFFKPNDTTAIDQLTAIDFLGYSPKMYYTRVAGPNVRNAVSSGTAVLVRNSDEFEGANLSSIQFVAKYAGSLGNDLTISIADSATFDSWEFKTNFDYKPNSGEYAIAVVDGSGNFTGAGKRKQQERLAVFSGGTTLPGVREVRTLTVSGTTLAADASGSYLGTPIALTSGDTAAVAAGKIATALAADPKYLSAVAAGATITVTYKTPGVVTDATTTVNFGTLSVAAAVTTPGTLASTISVFGTTVSLTGSETPTQAATKIATALNAYAPFTAIYESIVADKASVTYVAKAYGKLALQATPADQSGFSFSVDAIAAGRLGTLLEKYEIMTTDKASKFADGTTRYFADAINKASKYIYVGDKTLALAAGKSTLSGGVDDYVATRNAALAEYSNAEKLDVNYVWVAGSVSEQKAVADVVDTRKDCIGFFAPQMGDVVNRAGQELDNVLAWRTIALNRDTSYGFNTDNWALVYDQYNDVNRWIPTCGGAAGLVARTSLDFDPWYSPAGHQRGRLKKYLKLAWSANKAQRDELYKVGVNSIVDFPAEGILLYGDKTSTQRPSAFSRYNVRAAFIVAEKAIANFAKQFLFELNNAFTRAQFINAVRPFLRNMQGREAFEDFRVICDERNNDGQVRASNTMVGQILIKPLYSINFIVLDFAAVRPDVTFEEIEQYI